MKKYISKILGLSMAFALTLSSYAAMAQAKCANTSCVCGGSIIAGGCSISVCCKPNVATCQCSFFSNSCRCAPETGSTGGGSIGEVSVPTVYEQNVYDFASYLNSSDFASAQSKEIAAKLPTLITASQNKDAALYDATANRLEILANNLPAVEKSKANAWVTARGGTVFIQ